MLNKYQILISLVFFTSCGIKTIEVTNKSNSDLNFQMIKSNDTLNYVLKPNSDISIISPRNEKGVWTKSEIEIYTRNIQRINIFTLGKKYIIEDRKEIYNYFYNNRSFLRTKILLKFNN